MAGVFTSYSLLEPTATKKEVTRSLPCSAARKARGLGPVTASIASTCRRGTGRSVELGERNPNDAIDDLMQKTAPAFSGSVEGWFLAADKFERLVFPDKLLAARSPRVAIGIAHYKPKGSPWGAYGALIVSGSSGQMVANGGERGLPVF